MNHKQAHKTLIAITIFLSCVLLAYWSGSIMKTSIQDKSKIERLETAIKSKHLSCQRIINKEVDR